MIGTTMKLTIKQDIQLIAKRYRWAFDDLAIDQAYQEANRLVGSVRAQYDYLRGRLGSAGAVLASLRGVLRGSKHLVPGGLTRDQEFRWYAKSQPHVFEAAVEEEKDREAQGRSLKEQYQYLKSVFGSAESTREALRWIVRVQGRRVRTNHWNQSITT